MSESALSLFDEVLLSWATMPVREVWHDKIIQQHIGEWRSEGFDDDPRISVLDHYSLPSTRYSRLPESCCPTFVKAYRSIETATPEKDGAPRLSDDMILEIAREAQPVEIRMAIKKRLLEETEAAYSQFKSERDTAKASDIHTEDESASAN